MKKIFAFIFIISISLSTTPSLTFAQTVTSSDEATIASLTLLVQTLTQKLQQLLAARGSNVGVASSVSSNTTSGSSLVFTDTLAVGSKGKQVSALQTFLKSQGLLNANVTGYFGKATKTAV